ncbi:MAG: hypothetical protein OHK0052_26320 [Anaerolineales bacterium]
MRVQFEIFLGMLLTALAAGIILYAGLNEETRMETYDTYAQALKIERGAALFQEACSSCHGPQGLGVPGLCPPLNDAHFFNDRLKEVGWSGGLEDYIIATVSAGRLTSTRPEQYAGGGKPAMPAWGQAFGGPLRDDQIGDLAAFILNWRAEALARPSEPAVVIEGVGSDITVALPQGDAARGEALAAQKGCVGCHISAAVGPAWKPGAEPGIGDRAQTRFTAADYTGNATSAEQYLLESIVQTNVYVVTGFNPNIMPANYAETLTAQETADLIAYLLALK